MPEIDYTSGDSPSEVLDEFWRETLSGIRNGRWGSDIRTPIHAGILQLLEEKGIPEEEIEAALQKIVESIYGEEVRMAIHDALLLIHQESSQGGVEERIYYVDSMCTMIEGMLGSTVKFGIPVEWPESGSSYFADNATGEVTEITISASPIASGVCVLFAMYEQGDTPTITDSRTDKNWTSIKKFTPSGSNLVAEALYEFAAGGESFTVTLAKSTASSKFRATLRVFYGMGQPFITDEADELSSDYTYTPQSDLPPGSKRYYILANTGYSGYGMSVTVDAGGGSVEYNTHAGSYECYLYSASEFLPLFEFSNAQPANCIALGLKFL